MFEGAVTWLPCSFNFNASYASLFAMNLISGLKNDKITAFFKQNMFPKHYLKRYKPQK